MAGLCFQSGISRRDPDSHIAGYRQLPARHRECYRNCASRYIEWANTPAPQCGAILYKALDIMGRRATEMIEAITIEEG
jgi:acyl-CoA reductase-like NAD-dependent aldehyde dehydrogenase